MYSFVRTSNVSSASLNLRDFTNYLVANNGLSSSKYLLSVEAGTEVFTGAGTLNTTAYSVTMGGGGGGYVKIVNKHSGLLLGITNMSTSAGALALQWSDNGTDDHLWQIQS